MAVSLLDECRVTTYMGSTSDTRVFAPDCMGVRMGAKGGAAVSVVHNEQGGDVEVQ